jgi:integrase/recombinase XerC
MLSLITRQNPTSKVRVEISPQGVLGSFLSSKSLRTMRVYRIDLNDFKNFLQVESLEEAVVLLLKNEGGPANALVLSYRTHLMERKLASATVNRRLAALRSLWKLALLVGLVKTPLTVESIPQEGYRDTRGPGKEGIQKLFAWVEGKTDTKSVRDKALLRLLFDLALRSGEVQELKREHLSIENRTLSIHGKGRSQRETLTVPKKTCEAIGEWLKLRGNEPGPLIKRVENNGSIREGLSDKGIYLILRRLGAEAGVIVKPHGVRHASITEALNKLNGDVRKVQKFSRHKDVKVLMTYDDNRKDIAGEIAELLSET